MSGRLGGTEGVPRQNKMMPPTHCGKVIHHFQDQYKYVIQKNPPQSLFTVKQSAGLVKNVKINVKKYTE